jgi:AAA15 family ATPase/GTPase
MKIIAIELENIRGFRTTGKVEISDTINVFIGPNNAGKSTLLNSIYLLQRNVFSKADITLGQREGKIRLFYNGEHTGFIESSVDYRAVLFSLLNRQGHYERLDGVRGTVVKDIPSVEPNNLIYPYLSKRKVINYIDTINEQNANSVQGDFSNLYSKIDRLVTPQFLPGNKQYVEACNAILGFEVSTLAKGNGKQAVYFIKNLEHIPLTAMGEGVANILGLITDLCVAENRIFLIEEPENDIHPKALKALLKLIIEKSVSNQFFISTHSNIVMKYLGGVEGGKVFNVTNEFSDREREKLFVSKVTEVPLIPEARRQVLEDLGYDFFDFDLWKGWLFLEESSAEIIIRDYLIDWFVKPLKNKLRTFSAGGTSLIVPKFEDFDRLFVFLHMESTYKNRVWIIIDGGQEEKGIIERMKEKYSGAGWNRTNFSQFHEHNFEKYYPKCFQKRVKEILAIEKKSDRRAAKKELLEDVKAWIKKDESEAKLQFKESAKEVIEKLKKINRELGN